MSSSRPVPATPAPARVPARSIGLAAASMVGATAVLLILLQGATHPVGDYQTETDFYGSYAEGARLIQHGHVDLARYQVVGPVFEALLAMVGFVTGDLFMAAKLISVLAACGGLWLWFALLRRRLGDRPALWTIGFLAVHHVFHRYAYSVGTDAPSFLAQSAATLMLFGARGRRAGLCSGLLSALATLTRYTGIVLLPAAIVVYFVRARAQGRRGFRDLGLFLAGFLVIAGPWWWVTTSAGHPPGGALVRNVAFDLYGRASGITWDEFQSRYESQFPTIGSVVARDPAGFFAHMLGSVASHATGEATVLLGWPLALFCALGLVMAVVSGAWRPLAPILMLAALQFLALVPTSYLERYSLPMLPAYLALAGVAAASAAPAVGPKARRVALAAWVAIVPLAWSAWLTVEEYRRVWSELPVEVLPASQALRRLAAPGARVIARKPHLAYHAGVESAPFPPAYDLDDLARSVARLRADFLFFSNAEAKARPQFWFLLDTVMAVPGLRPVFFQARPPAALYRIGPELGMPLAWATDDTLRARLLGRARALDPVRSECSARLNLAAEALARRDAEVALRHLEIATGTCPDLPLAWTMAGDAWMGLQRPDSARASYQRALALDPAEARAKVGLGWSLLAAGELPLAARTWRDVVDRTDDPTTLETMARLFERIGDVEAARRARAARARPR